MQSIICIVRLITYQFSVIALLVCANVSASERVDGSAAVVVLGDSLSAAYNMASEQGWVALLKSKLEAQAPSYEVVNASVSGATTAAGLQLLPSLLEQYKPAIVVLELGANDGLQGKPLQYIRRNLDALINLSKTSGAKVLVVGIRLPPNYGQAYTEPFFDQFSELAQQYRAAYLPFLLEGVAGHPELMMADGLHPKPEAQELILANVWPALFPLINDLNESHIGVGAD